MVSGGNDRGHNHCIDEAAGNITADLLEDDREWARPGVTIGQAGIIIRHVQTDDDNGDEVEENNSPEHVANDFG